MSLCFWETRTKDWERVEIPWWRVDGMEILTGLVKKARPREETFLGIVTENRRERWVVGTSERIWVIKAQKSRSRRRSASSMTRYLMGRRKPLVFSRWPRRRPRVALWEALSYIRLNHLVVKPYDYVRLFAENNGLRNEVHTADKHGATCADCAAQRIEMLRYLVSQFVSRYQYEPESKAWFL